MAPPIAFDHPLEDDQRESLDRAVRALQSAVAEYEKSIAEMANRDQLDAGLVAIEDAERELWRLRGELLRWSRPSWAPSASLVADWFSEEDRVYDNVAGVPLVVARATTGPN